MKTYSLIRVGRVVILVAFFCLAFWCRLTSLNTSPMVGHDADGAFFGVQAERLAHGQAVELKTGGGKIVDPLYMMVEAPLHLFWQPSFVIQRLPAVFFGVLAVVLLYRLAARSLDRTTAILAAGLLAAMPIAIIYSRLGWEYSEVPAVCVLIIFGAYTNQRILLFLSFMFGLHISPTIVTMAPVPLCILAGQWVRAKLQRNHDEARGYFESIIVLTGVTILYGLTIAGSPRVKASFDSPVTAALATAGWDTYLTLYMRLLLGFCQEVPSETGRTLFWIFWGSIGTLTVVGSYRMIREQRWDLLAFPLGWLASLVGFYLAIGPIGLHPLTPRYGLFLVVPAVVAVAALANAVLLPVDTRWMERGRRVQLAAMLFVGFTLLFSYKTNYFDYWPKVAGQPNESFWTFKSETPNTVQSVATIIRKDLSSRTNRPPVTSVLAQDWWSYKPIQMFTMRRADLEVSSLESIPPDQKATKVREGLESGGYVVGIEGEQIDQAVKGMYTPDHLQQWRVRETAFIPTYMLYRLRR